MSVYRVIAVASIALLSGCAHTRLHKGWLHEVWIKPEQLDSYVAQAVAVFENPTNWIEQGAEAILEFKCKRVPNRRPWFMVSEHSGGELGDDPYVVVCIPVETPYAVDDGDESFIGVAFHHPSGKLELVGLGAIAREVWQSKFPGDDKKEATTEP